MQLPPKKLSFSLDNQFLYTLSRNGEFTAASLDFESSLWHNYCETMDLAKGWVKDGNGRHLLWIPDHYRDMVSRTLTLRAQAQQEVERLVINYRAVLGAAEGRWVERFEELLDKQSRSKCVDRFENLTRADNAH